LSPSDAVRPVGHRASWAIPMNRESAFSMRRVVPAVALSALSLITGTAQVEQSADYRPALAVSDSLAPFVKQLEPGGDDFPLERQAKDLEAPLREFSDAFRRRGPGASGAITRLLD